MADAQDSLDVSDLKENFLECSVCLEHFDQAERRPRLLVNCLHSFCSQCLDQLLKKEGRGQVTCPNCRQVQKVKGNAQSLPVDPVRNKLVDYVKFKKGKKIPCSDCPDGSHAVARCHECQSYMCTPCKEAHHRNRSTRKHTCQSLEEALSEPVKNFLSHRCEDHPDYKIEFYCGKCSSLCCVSCTIVKHRGHILDPIEDAANSMLSSLKMKMEDVKKSTSVLRRKKTSLDQESKMQEVTLKHTTDSINKNFDELIGKLNCQRNKLITELKDKTKSTVNGLKKQLEATEDSLGQMESTLEYFKQMESKSDDCEVLSAGPVVVQSLAAATVNQTEDVHPPTWTFSLGEMDNIISRVHRFGEIQADTSMESLGGRKRFKNTPNTQTVSSALEPEELSFDYDKGYAKGAHINVSVYKANITDLPVEVIVNGANGHLSHGGGVARAISSAAGHQMTAEDSAFIQHCLSSRPANSVGIAPLVKSSGKSLQVDDGKSYAGAESLSSQEDLKTKFQFNENVSVAVIKDNIFKVEANALVSWEDCGTMPFHLFQKNLVSEGGKSYEDERKKKMLMSKKGDVVPTTSGNLIQNQIFHAFVGMSTSLEDFVSLVTKLFSQCVSWNYTSVLLPIFHKFSSTVKGKKPVNLFMETVVDVLTKLSEEKERPMLRVIIVEQEDTVVQDLSSALSQYFISLGLAQNTDKSIRGDKKCPICFDKMTYLERLACGHAFCKECLKKSFDTKKACPICGRLYGPIIGTMPKGEMRTRKESSSLPGFPGCGTIVITYNIPDGTQTDEHPNPGKPFVGAFWRAYLPDSYDGRKVLALLRVAFERRLTVTVGQSVSRGGDEDRVTWNEIHHKTSRTGDSSGFGYPDETYLQRVQEELKQKGITEKDLETAID